MSPHLFHCSHVLLHLLRHSSTQLLHLVSSLVTGCRHHTSKELAHEHKRPESNTQQQGISNKLDAQRPDAETVKPAADCYPKTGGTRVHQSQPRQHGSGNWQCAGALLGTHSCPPVDKVAQVLEQLVVVACLQVRPLEVRVLQGKIVNRKSSNHQLPGVTNTTVHHLPYAGHCMHETSTQEVACHCSKAAQNSPRVLFKCRVHICLSTILEHRLQALAWLVKGHCPAACSKPQSQNPHLRLRPIGQQVVAPHLRRDASLHSIAAKHT